MLYDSNHIAFWKRYNYGDSQQISGLPGVLQGRKGDRWTTENVYGSENTLHDTIMMHACH